MTNSRFTSKSFALLLCLASLALILFVFGCNTERVTAPTPAPERIVTNPNPIVILSAPKNGTKPALVPGVSKVISAASGGSVGNEYVRLDFPPGALNGDTEVTIDMPEPGKMVFVFGPHGIHFNKPVTMTVFLDKTNAAGMADMAETLWFNEQMGWWEPVEKIESSDPNAAESLLEHFSKYAADLGG